MFPQFEIYWVTIYSFWVALSISFLLFFWMLYRLSLKFWINSNFFLNNVFFYFISIFFFSRLFYIFSEWRDFKFVFREGYIKFLFMSDYNFSLIWWIFGFLIVLYFKIKNFKLKSEKYVDAIVLSFLFAWIIWFIWAFFWWQIIWKPTSLAIWVTYTSAFSKSPFSWPIFPLGIAYSIICFILFVWLYITRVFVKMEWYIWYLWMALFWAFLLILEFFNWIPDSFNSYIFINITQLWAIWLIVIAARWLKKIYKQDISA